MTRHPRFDVRVAPRVLAAYGSTSGGAPRTASERALAGALDRLRREGTRARGAKEFKGLDLWEIRFKDQRAFFRLIPRRDLIAVGFAQTKQSGRLPARRLRYIERVIRAWSDELETTG